MRSGTSGINKIVVFCLCACCLVLISPSWIVPSAQAQTSQNSTTKTAKVKAMLAERGYQIENIRVVIIDGKRVLDVDARRGRERINLKILEATLQIMKESRY